MPSQTHTTDVVAVILAGGAEFGLCPLRGKLHPSMWSVAGQPAASRIIEQLASYGIKRVTVTVRDEMTGAFTSLLKTDGIEVVIQPETMPAGTAGAVRDAAGSRTDCTVIVLQANTTDLPDISYLLTTHKERSDDMTVVLDRDGQAIGMYIIEAHLLAHIPAQGYFDIKEDFVPLLLLNQYKIRCQRLDAKYHFFSDSCQYLTAMTDFIRAHSPGDGYSSVSPGVMVHNTAVIHPRAAIRGPTLIMPGAAIEQGAIVQGPCIIEPDVCIGTNAVVSHSVIWTGTRIGANSQILGCLVTGGSIISPWASHRHSIVDLQSDSSASSLSGAIKCDVARFQAAAREGSSWLTNMAARFHPAAPAMIAAGFMLIAFIWLYRFELSELWVIWHRSDEYSSGMLVLPMIVYILYIRRRQLKAIPIKPYYPAIAIFILAQMFRAVGVFFMYASIERYSMLLSAASLVLLLCGTRFFKSVIPVMLFSILMLPLPQSVHSHVMIPLQNWATSSAIFCLELLGMDVVREGNILQVGNATVAVAEACNGLRMITAFFVVTGLVVLLVNRSWQEKLIVLLSTIPIALACNAVRLALTAIAFTVIDGPRYAKLFHDFGGLAMMPLAVAMVMLELWVLSKVFLISTVRAGYGEVGSFILKRSAASEAGNG